MNLEPSHVSPVSSPRASVSSQQAESAFSPIPPPPSFKDKLLGGAQGEQDQVEEEEELSLRSDDVHIEVNGLIPAVNFANRLQPSPLREALGKVIPYPLTSLFYTWKGFPK